MLELLAVAVVVGHKDAIQCLDEEKICDRHSQTLAVLLGVKMASTEVCQLHQEIMVGIGQLLASYLRQK